jgi:integrase
MSDKPISDLRRRMIADMTVRSFSDKTQHDYIRYVEAFARFLGRSPDTATGDDIRRFQLAPQVLTLDQVARLLKAAPGPGLKHKAALGIAYGAGLRGGEVVMLRVSDIDSERMLIRVEMGSLPQARDGDQMLSRPRDRHRERG